MKLINLFFIFLINVLINNCYAYCIYNVTTGNDTAAVISGSKEYNPTEIEFTDNNGQHKIIAQGKFSCELTKQRGENDNSSITVNHILEIGFPGEFICVNTLFNKGGYMLVQGNAKDGFKCDTYRD